MLHRFHGALPHDVANAAMIVHYRWKCFIACRAAKTPLQCKLAGAVNNLFTRISRRADGSGYQADQCNQDGFKHVAVSVFLLPMSR